MALNLAEWCQKENPKVSFGVFMEIELRIENRLHLEAVGNKKLSAFAFLPRMEFLVEILRLEAFQSQKTFFEPHIVFVAEAGALRLGFAHFSGALMSIEIHHFAWHLFLRGGVVFHILFVFRHGSSKLPTVF
jgi:hypothetical protein